MIKTQTSLYSRIADLPLEIESFRLIGLESDTGRWIRKTTIIELAGKGQSGQGEDITYQSDEQERFRVEGPHLDLAGAYTVDSFSQALDGKALLTEEPESGPGPQPISRTRAPGLRSSTSRSSPSSRRYRAVEDHREMRS